MDILHNFLVLGQIVMVLVFLAATTVPFGADSSAIREYVDCTGVISWETTVTCIV